MKSDRRQLDEVSSIRGLKSLSNLVLAGRTDLESAFSQLRAKHIDVGLHPQRDECFTISQRSAGGLVEQESPCLQVVHAGLQRAERNTDLLGQRAIRRTHKLWLDEKRHDRLDPRRLRSPEGSRRGLGRPAALDVYEQPGRLEVRVPGKIEVVDPLAFKDRGLLRPNMGREQQDPAIALGAGECRTLSVQSLDDHADILMGEVSLLFYQVPDGVVGCLPPKHPVKAARALDWPDLGVRHPFQDHGSGRLCVWRGRDVRDDATFINIEHDESMNDALRPGISSGLRSCVACRRPRWFGRCAVHPLPLGRS